MKARFDKCMLDRHVDYVQRLKDVDIEALKKRLQGPKPSWEEVRKHIKPDDENSELLH
jgi:hypothetical protein